MRSGLKEKAKSVPAPFSSDQRNKPFGEGFNPWGNKVRTRKVRSRQWAGTEGSCPMQPVEGSV